MQANLRSMFAGKREVVAELEKKRGPGRPPKLRKMTEEEKDEVLAVLESKGIQFADIPSSRKVEGSQRFHNDINARAAEASQGSLGKSSGKLRMPESGERDASREAKRQEDEDASEWAAGWDEDLG